MRSNVPAPGHLRAEKRNTIRAANVAGVAWNAVFTLYAEGLWLSYVKKGIESSQDN